MLVSPVGITMVVTYFLLFFYMYFMKHSVKWIPTMLITLFGILYCTLWAEKGFIRDTTFIQTCLTVFAQLIMCLIIVLFILAKSYVPIAGLMIVLLIVSSSLITYVYKSEYDQDDSIQALFGITLFLFACVTLTVYLMASKYLMGLQFQYHDTVLWILVTVMIICFGVLLIIFSGMPKLINYDKVCVRILKNDTIRN